MNKLYRGIFWIKDLDNLENNSNYLIKIETNENGDVLDCPFPLNSKKGDNYVHQKTWLLLNNNLTKNKPFDYYPRGRVEIKHGDVLIYINPILNRQNIIDYLKKEYCLQDNTKVIMDFHEHYKCNFDKGDQ